MATAFRTAAHEIAHDNFTVIVGPPMERPVSQKAVYVTISNRSVTPGDGVNVSFDGGLNYYTIDDGSSFSFEIWGIKSYFITPVAGNADVQCLYGLEG